jgi:hypothetical protein
MKRHSVVIDGHKTSVSLEDEFWDGLKESAVARQYQTVHPRHQNCFQATKGKPVIGHSAVRTGFLSVTNQLIGATTALTADRHRLQFVLAPFQRLQTRGQ